jgi:hypothetical protein
MSPLPPADLASHVITSPSSLHISTTNPHYLSIHHAPPPPQSKYHVLLLHIGKSINSHVARSQNRRATKTRDIIEEQIPTFFAYFGQKVNFAEMIVAKKV